MSKKKKKSVAKTHFGCFNNNLSVSSVFTGFIFKKQALFTVKCLDYDTHSSLQYKVDCLSQL